MHALTNTNAAFKQAHSAAMTVQDHCENTVTMLEVS